MRLFRAHFCCAALKQTQSFYLKTEQLNLILSIYQIVSKNVYQYQMRKIQRSYTKGLWVKLRMFNHIFERSQRDLVNTTYSSFFPFQFMCFRMRVCSSIKVMFRACFGSSSMLAICINFHFFSFFAGLCCCFQSWQPTVAKSRCQSKLRKWHKMQNPRHDFGYQRGGCGGTSGRH